MKPKKKLKPRKKPNKGGREIMEEIAKAVADKPPEKPYATKTMYITTFDGQNTKTIVVDNFSHRYELEKQTGTFTLLRGKLPHLQVGRTYDICVESTSDPTPRMAGETVSLGYFRFTCNFRGCTMTNDNPPTFQGWTRMFTPNILLSLREF